MSKASVYGKDELICHFQTAEDIKRAIRRAEYESRGFAKRLKPFFNSNDKEKVCKRVWTFLRLYINYKAEPKQKQTAMRIPVFFVRKRGDCKHYATTSVGILRACGVPAWFCIVRQGGDKTKWHAYCNALVNGNVITVDPCRKRFDSECRFVKKYNVSPIK